MPQEAHRRREDQIGPKLDGDGPTRDIEPGMVQNHALQQQEIRKKCACVGDNKRRAVGTDAGLLFKAVFETLYAKENQEREQMKRIEAPEPPALEACEICGGGQSARVIKSDDEAAEHEEEVDHKVAVPNERVVA